MAIVLIHGLYIFLIIFPITADSSPDSDALLRLKSSFKNQTPLDSWTPETEPCANGNGRWEGVVCENGVVSGLRLSKLGLAGTVDVAALASLSGLRSVSLTFNAFSGPIPEFHANAALKGLYITGNQFSGEIPADFFVKMKGLKKVWLSENNFSGPIPSSLAGLPKLVELHLEDNHFSGLIPALEQQGLLSVNFSNNDLEGEVPPSLSRFGADAFQGNPGMKRRKSHRSSNENLATAFLFVMGCVALLLVVVAIVLFLVRRRGRGDGGVEGEHGKQNLETPLTSSASSTRKFFGSSKKVFGSSIYGRRTRDELVFLNKENGSFGLPDMMGGGAEVMRHGVLGSAFKTTMAGGMAIVVKRVREFNKIERDEFDEKLRWLGSLRHKNVLPPLAYYNGKDEKLLVYEYQHKGSLLLQLHDCESSSPVDLNWPLRLKIIQGVARGLDFLHTELSTLELPHGDLKSSNVLLSTDYEPLLADYGFWSLISHSPVARSLVAYKAPEAMEKNYISPKCDVYFLGVMILEILARKFPSQYLSNAQGGTDVVLWARSTVAEGREGDLLDPDVANTDDFVQHMKQFIHIALACTEDDPDRRLGLKEAVSRIEAASTGTGGDRDTTRHDVSPSSRDQSGSKSFTFEIS